MSKKIKGICIPLFIGLLAFTLLAGCYPIKTKIMDRDGMIFCLESVKEAVVTMKRDGVEITIDNRGRPGVLENMMGILMLKTDIAVGD